MAGLTKRHGVVASALAIASCSSLVLAAAPAGAVAATRPAYYAGSTSADVLGLTLKLPAALPNVPNPIQIGLIHIDGSTVHDPDHLAGNVAASAEGTASLATGSLVDALQKTLGVNLDRIAHVELGHGPDSSSTSLVDIPAKPLADVSVGSLEASLNKLTDGSSSGANGVTATLGDADDLLGKATVSTVSGALTPIVNQVSSTVNQVLSQLSGVTSSTPVAGTATATVKDTVKAILSKVQNLVANLGTTALVSVDVHDVSQAIAPTADGVQAESKLGLVGVNLLGGLLTVNGFSSGATAFANGKPGGAHVTSFADKPIVSVNAANALCAQLTTNGISLCSATGLPKSVQKQINSLLAQLSGELTQLESTLLNGAITVSEVPGASHTAADGSAASVTAPSYAVNVANVAKLDLGSGVTAAVAAAQANPRVVHKLPAGSTPKTPSEPSTPAPVELPHTGANLGLIGMVALLFLGAAAVLRRRFARPTTD